MHGVGIDGDCLQTDILSSASFIPAFSPKGVWRHSSLWSNIASGGEFPENQRIHVLMLHAPVLAVKYPSFRDVSLFYSLDSLCPLISVCINSTIHVAVSNDFMG